jgi:4'-phosphopantetheinyl transferase
MARLAAAPKRLARLEALLSTEERARAARYRSASDGPRFIVRLATLRLGLAGLVGVAPQRIQFGCGPAGKPYVSEPSFARVLSFNLAHSDGLAVFACSPDGVSASMSSASTTPEISWTSPRVTSPGASGRP